ncbi:MAG: hypothetical protein A2Y88_12515 [Chloroflexi bacterium RBG_13_48_10]|nr:MAG: hypothetical protein A2Y88_12515 [Chloroflexi bacterium RBG_13_48_10]
MPHISIKERSIQKITDVLIRKRFSENRQNFKTSHLGVIGDGGVQTITMIVRSFSHGCLRFKAKRNTFAYEDEII